MKKIAVILVATILLSCSKSTNLDELIGLDIKSNKMQSFLNGLGNPEISKHEAQAPIPARTIEINGRIDTISKARNGWPASTYYVYKGKGIQIKLDENNIVDAIFLFGESNEGYRQYQENLPFDLKFTNTRKDVIEKLGKQDKSFGGSSKYNIKCIDFWNKSKELSVTYNTTDSTNMSATISSICLAKLK